MKINQESSGRYVPPRVKMVEISTRSHILTVSQWQEGSHSESGDMNDGEW